jgi:hypothetical protein
MNVQGGRPDIGLDHKSVGRPGLAVHATTTDRSGCTQQRQRIRIVYESDSILTLTLPLNLNRREQG